MIERHFRDLLEKCTMCRRKQWDMTLTLCVSASVRTSYCVCARVYVCVKALEMRRARRADALFCIRMRRSGGSPWPGRTWPLAPVSGFSVWEKVKAGAHMLIPCLLHVHKLEKFPSAHQLTSLLYSLTACPSSWSLNVKS